MTHSYIFCIICFQFESWCVSQFSDYFGDFIKRGLRDSFKSEVLVKLCGDSRADSYTESYRDYNSYYGRSSYRDRLRFRSSSADHDKSCNINIRPANSKTDLYKIKTTSRCGSCLAEVRLSYQGKDPSWITNAVQVSYFK